MIGSAYLVVKATTIGPQAERVACKDRQRAKRRAPDPVMKEATRIGGHRATQHHASRHTPQPLAEDHILQHRHNRKAAKLLEERAADKDGLVAEVNAGQATTQVVHGRDQPQSPVRGGESMAERTRLPIMLVFSCSERLQRTGRQSGVDMKKQQQISCGNCGTGIHLHCPALRRVHETNPRMLRHTGHSSIRASAIHDNDLEASGLPEEILESCRKQRRLVENRNDDGDHSRMVAQRSGGGSAMGVFRPGAVTCPTNPPPKAIPNNLTSTRTNNEHIHQARRG